MKNLKILLPLLALLVISCQNDDIEGGIETREFVPTDVLVGIKSGVGITQIFNFINEFDHDVENLNSIAFTSDLPSSNLQYVLDYLNDKPYTNNGDDWFVTGYLHYQTNQITVFPRLFEINNTEYQEDWLSTMILLKLKIKYDAGISGGIIHFNVPEGEELEWESTFKSYDIVDWAELNYIGGAQPATN